MNPLTNQPSFIAGPVYRVAVPFQPHGTPTYATVPCAPSSLANLTAIKPIMAYDGHQLESATSNLKQKQSLVNPEDGVRCERDGTGGTNAGGHPLSQEVPTTLPHNSGDEALIRPPNDVRPQASTRTETPAGDEFIKRDGVRSPYKEIIQRNKVYNVPFWTPWCQSTGSVLLTEPPSIPHDVEVEHGTLFFNLVLEELQIWVRHVSCNGDSCWKAICPYDLFEIVPGHVYALKVASGRPSWVLQATIGRRPAASERMGPNIEARNSVAEASIPEFGSPGTVRGPLRRGQRTRK